MEAEGDDEDPIEDLKDLKDAELSRNLKSSESPGETYNRPTFSTIRLGGMNIRIPILRLPSEESLDALRDVLGEQSPSATPTWLKPRSYVPSNDEPANDLSTTEGRNEAALRRSKLQNQQKDEVENTVNKDASKNSTAKTQNNDKAGSGTKRAKSTAELRKEWENIHNKPWPKEPLNSKRNQVAHHKTPLADKGKDEGANIEPKSAKEHVEHHKKNGDFQRWSKRKGT